jgi:hypothetical protein
MRILRLTTAFDCVLISVLLLLFCIRIWDIGILHTDDAVWALWALQPGVDPVGDFARSQGRLWAYPVGNLQLYALAWQGTVYGETLKIGSFIVFFAAFHIFAAMYCGRRIAMFSACLFFALFALRWEESWLTAGGFGLWTLASMFMASVFFGRAYAVNGKPIFAVMAGLCLFASLFSSEGVSVLYAALFPLTILGNLVATKDRIEPSAFLRAGQIRTLSITYLLAVAGYIILAGVWALQHPSQYAGHALAPFNPIRIAMVLVDFATSNSLLRDLIRPYSVNFGDVISGSGTHAVYNPWTFISTLIWHPAALMFGLITAIVFFRVVANSNMTRTRTFRTEASEIFAYLAGLGIAVLPILPAAATTKYQTWYFDLGVTSFSTAILSYFGISLILAASISRALSGVGSRRRTFLAIALTAAIGIFASISYRMNDAIAIDMRPESGRWRVLGLALESVRDARMDVAQIWAPRFRSGSWFTVVSTAYWSEYAKARYKMDIGFLDTLPSADELRGVAYLDYMLADDDRSFVAVVARLQPINVNGQQKVLADKIVIGVEQPTTAMLRNYWLFFSDDKGLPHQIQLAQLEPQGQRSGVRVLENVLIAPESIRIGRQTLIGFLPILCSAAPSTNSTINFGTGASGNGGCIGTAFLKSGWGPPERLGVWSLGTEARLSIPSAGFRGMDGELVFDLSTYVGLGFHRGTQTVQAKVKDRLLATWTFATGLPAPDTRIVVPASFLDPSGVLDITLEINPPMNPHKLGLAPDDRDLGISLRAVGIQSVKN